MTLYHALLIAMAVVVLLNILSLLFYVLTRTEKKTGEFPLDV